ncbi:MAG: hypothetical protein ACFE96_12410 [Candidatus Hermodarchaeota archaeon]
MVRKGKFRLFSFLIEQHLIYYKSVNKSNKLVAFSVLKINNLLKILPLLNDFLLNKFLYYYSVQIDVPKNIIKTIVLAFVGSDKSKIDKFFNLIFQKVKEYDKSFTFLKNHDLEKHFFHIFSNNNDINTLKMGDSLALKQGEILLYLHCYEVNCDLMLDGTVSLHNLLKALNNFNQRGYLTFNIKSLNSGLIVSNAYFVNIRNEIEHDSMDIEEELNNLFICKIFKKSILQTNRLYCILWRANFSEIYYNTNQDLDLFLSLSPYNFQDLSKFSVQFDKSLRLNQIAFHQLKPNLFFIEEKILFLILDQYNPVEISRILEQFFSKYYVFILILNMDEYNKLIQSNEIRLLENIKTLNFKDFIGFNIRSLKDEYKLKNT